MHIIGGLIIFAILLITGLYFVDIHIALHDYTLAAVESTYSSR